jgi:hypothetical protein
VEGFENTAMRRIFGLERKEVTGGRRKCNMRSFVTSSFHS